MSTHLINGLPLHVFGLKSPSEILYNKPLDYSMLRVFVAIWFILLRSVPMLISLTPEEKKECSWGTLLVGRVIRFLV